MRIYLDNCCYGRPYDDKEQLRIREEAESKVSIQELIRTGRLSLVASFWNLYENERRNDLNSKDMIADFIQNYATVIMDRSEFHMIRPLVREIVKTGIKMPDAIHIASAIKCGCDYFITTDDRVLKYKTNRVILINPVHFIKMVSDFE